ncbi:unnamed protein product [Prunus armeniaca]
MAMMDTCGCSRIFVVIVHDEERMVVVVIVQIGYPARLADQPMLVVLRSRDEATAIVVLCRSLLGYYSSGCVSPPFQDVQEEIYGNLTSHHVRDSVLEVARYLCFCHTR